MPSRASGRTLGWMKDVCIPTTALKIATIALAASLVTSAALAASPTHIDSVILHLLVIPAIADSQDQSPIGNPVQGGELFGKGDVIVLSR